MATPPNPSGGRPLRPREPNTEPDGADGASASAAQPSDVAGPIDPSGDTSTDVDEDAELVRESKPREELVLIWNHTTGIRPGVHSKPVSRDPAGNIVWDTKTFNFLPGLNICPASMWPELRPGLAARIRGGEIEEVRPDVKPRRLIEAIAETSTEEVLRWLLEAESGGARRGAVLEAIEKALASLRSGGAFRGRIRSLQQAHTARG
jgi:hypothetical protein